jgi:ketosteroid isomerase-like protein
MFNTSLVMKIPNYQDRALLCMIFCLIFTMGMAQSSDEQTIRDLRLESNEAIKMHDTATLATAWLEDVYVLTSRSVSLAGRRANQRAFHQEFQKANLIYVRTPTTIELFPDWDMAGEYGQWTGAWTTNGNAVRVGGSYYAKWHKVHGNWKIKSETYMPTLCEGAGYCSTINIQNAPSAIVVQNLYFPKPGMEKEVMETRERASDVRAKLGLPAGRILLRVSESTSQPYIIWECEYPSVRAREEDVATLDRSSEFTDVQEHMTGLLLKFDRSVWQVIR